jgi:hypothetical protein
MCAAVMYPAVAHAKLDPKEKAALLDIYDATGGPGWRNNSNWGTPAGACTWYGVSCNADGTKVTQL